MKRTGPLTIQMKGEILDETSPQNPETNRKDLNWRDIFYHFYEDNVGKIPI